ncbi:MAG: hypothetical protein OEL20_05415 [Sulfuritalea sp.]|nr:hypothetical protein [Sulfuritalea sp.]
MSETNKEPATVETAATGTFKLPPVNLLMIASIVAAAYFLTLFIQEPSKDAAAHSARIAVIDMDRILRAKALGVGVGNAANIAAEAEGFARKIKEETELLTRSGYVVINTAHLVAWPDGMDSTATLAKKLGVDLKLVDQDDAARGARIQNLLQKSAAPK